MSCLKMMIGSAFTLSEPDEDVPFYDVVGEFEKVPSVFTMCPPAVNTPIGNELVFDGECDEVTRIYPPGYVERLTQEAAPHTHGTLPAFQAVKPFG